jgi:hypothetical protein
MLRGSGVHRGAQHNFSQKVESKQDLKADDIIDFAVNNFDERLETDGCYLAPDERSRGQGIVVAEERDRVWRLSSLMATQLAPTIQPEAVEAQVTADFSTLNFKVVGTIDLITVSQAIRDLKSATKSRSKGDQHKDFQITTYAALYFALKKQMPTSLGLDVLVDLKKGPKLQQLETTRTVEDFTVWFNRIIAFDEAIKSGNFPPTNGQNWWCSPRWCGYWEDCSYISSSERSRVLEGD